MSDEDWSLEKDPLVEFMQAWWWCRGSELETQWMKKEEKKKKKKREKAFFWCMSVCFSGGYDCWVLANYGLTRRKESVWFWAWFAFLWCDWVFGGGKVFLCCLDLEQGKRRRFVCPTNPLEEEVACLLGSQALANICIFFHLGYLSFEKYRKL